MRVSLFITCYNDTLFPETGKAVVRVLERLGHTIDFPPDQTCCGQMHWNTGYHREAVPIIRHFVETFRNAEVVCIPSSSCVAMIRDHYQKAAVASGDHAFIADVEALLPRVYEFSEFLVNKLGITDVGASYPASRHLSRQLPLHTQPASRRYSHSPAARCPGPRTHRSTRNRPMLRLRRHLRHQERGCLLRHARRQNPPGAQHHRRGLHRRRQLLPHAHLRWAPSRSAPASRQPTSPRSSPAPRPTTESRCDARHQKLS